MNDDDSERAPPLAFDPAETATDANPALVARLSALGAARGWVVLAPAWDGAVMRYGVTDHPPVSKDTDAEDLTSVALRAELHHDTENDTYEALLFAGRQVGAEFERTRELGRGEWTDLEAAIDAFREMITAPEAWENSR